VTVHIIDGMAYLAEWSWTSHMAWLIWQIGRGYLTWPIWQSGHGYHRWHGLFARVAVDIIDKMAYLAEWPWTS
jgi:hypothetical protein